MGSSRVIHAEAHTSIRRPVAVVFRWLTDPALVPLWVTGLVVRYRSSTGRPRTSKPRSSDAARNALS